MDTTPIISARNLTKAYRLYVNQLDRLKEIVLPRRKKHELFYALTNISFDLYAGEHLGILGVNGAGKSTLLQLLTGILTPTSGEVCVSGRIGAMLELGAGFNPELTGRQNTEFLLSMSFSDRKIIADMVSQVENFADIGNFFDQPMKLYSSGMYVRVGFAANAISVPDILVVDEALAVGDVRFQKKCFDYIEKLKVNGTTFIYVTHDVLGAKNFCTRLIFLDKGQIMADGLPSDVATKYYRFLYPNTSGDTKVVPDRSSFSNGTSEIKSLTAKIDVAKGEDYVVATAESIIPDARENAYVYHIEPNPDYVPWGAGGILIREMRIFELDAPNILRHSQLAVECDYIIRPDQINRICEQEHLKPSMLVGLRFDSARGLTIFDLGNAILENGELDVDLLKDRKVTIRFSCTLPVFYAGEYFLTPVVSMGTLNHFVSLCGYDNLGLINVHTIEQVLGILRPDFSISRIC